MSRWLTPVWISNDGQEQKMSALPFGTRAFDEAELQRLIEAHPSLLAVDQFDPIFSPTVCMGRKVRTPAGPLDNLYIRPGRHITIVETKLWKKPQARREVNRTAWLA